MAGSDYKILKRQSKEENPVQRGVLQHSAELVSNDCSKIHRAHHLIPDVNGRKEEEGVEGGRGGRIEEALQLLQRLFAEFP